MTITDANAAVDKEWMKLETIPAWQLDKVKCKKEVIPQAQRDHKKVHSLCYIDGHMSSRKCGVRAKKSEVRRSSRAPKRDIVKDDSGAYAVSIEQGSSASQMTAANVMDVLTRLPG